MTGLAVLGHHTYSDRQQILGFWNPINLKRKYSINRISCAFYIKLCCKAVGCWGVWVGLWTLEQGSNMMIFPPNANLIPLSSPDTGYEFVASCTTKQRKGTRRHSDLFHRSGSIVLASPHARRILVACQLPNCASLQVAVHAPSARVTAVGR